MRKGLAILAMAMLLAVPAGASQVEKVVFLITNLGAEAAYYANDGDQPGDQGDLYWAGGETAFVYLVGEAMPLELDVTGTAHWSQCTDTSGLPGTNIAEAAAIFEEGSFTFSFSHEGTPLGSMTGSLAGNHYIEGETSPDYLYGSALIRVDTFDLTKDAEDYAWQGGIGDLGGVMVSTQLAVNTNLQSYHEDWSSNNCLITVLADETYIPEPATMGLLALGGLVVVYRRRRSR